MGIQDDLQNGRHYLVCMISLQLSLLQLQIKCLNMGLQSWNVMKSFVKLFEKHISKYLIIRHLDEFWGANFSDQTIEEFVMQMTKRSGWMMHGWGIMDGILTKWVHALPCCVSTCDALDQFTGVHPTTSEQTLNLNKDLCSGTQSMDNRVHDIFVHWLMAHPQFAGYDPDCLVSSQMDGQISLTSSYTEMIKWRLLVKSVRPSNGDKRMVADEFAPQPRSLFNDGVMQKSVKSAVGIMLKSCTTQQCNRQ